MGSRFMLARVVDGHIGTSYGEVELLGSDLCSVSTMSGGSHADLDS